MRMFVISREGGRGPTEVLFYNTAPVPGIAHRYYYLAHGDAHLPSDVVMRVVEPGNTLIQPGSARFEFVLNPPRAVKGGYLVETYPVIGVYCDHVVVNAAVAVATSSEPQV